MSDSHSTYYDREGIAQAVANNQHREVIGGLWDEIGDLQMEFLKANGLKPANRLLDIGCGSLRLGVRAVAYLDTGNYWGTDINESLLNAGYEEEIVPAGLAEKMPRRNLLADGDFDFSGLPHEFDMIVAQSLFTHLPINHLRLCLANLAKHIDGACEFFATVFIAPNHAAAKPFNHAQGGVTTFPHLDPYHCTIADLHHVAAGLPWTVNYVGDWEHPRGQMMVRFSKPANTASSATRQLTAQDAESLAPGDDHYRAFVGPTDRFDFMSSSQFALLCALGMREDDKILDFGCGSLRLGRLLIPFLKEGGYYGIDPNEWLINEGLDREVGRGILGIKSPHFAYNDNFSTEVFSERFDFIMAQSILTHTGPGSIRTFLQSVAKSLTDNGLLLFSYIREINPNAPLPADGWYYPGCVGYSEDWMMEQLRNAGLHGMPLPWFHPGAAWMAASPSEDGLPQKENLHLLKGSVLRDSQFVGSIR